MVTLTPVDNIIRKPSAPGSNMTRKLTPLEKPSAPGPAKWSAKDELRLFENALLKEQKAGKLNRDGEKILSLIQSGPVLEGGIGAFAQGLSLYFSDEIIANISNFFGVDSQLTKELNKFRKARVPGEKPFSEYEVSLGLERKGVDQYRSENPVKSISLELGGAVVPTLLSRGATLPITLAKAFGSGVTAGFGSGEGGPEKRLQGAAIGGALGPVAAGGMRGAGHLLKKGWQAALSPGAATRGRQHADDLVRDAIESDVGSVSQAASTVAAAQARGKPMSIADIGPNTRGVADVAHVLPGPAKSRMRKFLEDRDRNMIHRLSDDLKAAFGKRGRFFPEFAAMSKARAARGGKIYDRANKKLIPVGDELSALFGRPVMRDALEKAYTIAANQGVKLPTLKINEFGKLVTGEGYAVKSVQTKFLHYLKLGMDDKIYGSNAMTGIGKIEKGGMQDTRHALLRIMDRNNKTYKIARNYWAGETSALNAMILGRNFLKQDADEFAAVVKQMSRSEKEALRVGSMQGLMDMIEGGVESANLARNIIKRPRNLQLIRATFEPGENGTKMYNSFIKNLTTEVDMKMTSSQILGNSATAARQEGIAALKTAAERSVPRVAGAVETALNLLRKNADEISERQIQAATVRIGDIMSTADDVAVQKLFKQLGTRSGTQRFLEGVTQGVPAAVSRVLSPPAVTGVTAGNIPPETRDMVPVDDLRGLLGL